MDYDINTTMINAWHEERCKELARSYADGQADVDALRTLLAKVTVRLGDLFDGSDHMPDSTSGTRKQRRLVPVEVRVKNGH